ncbi:uncharacterized protein N7458_009019 [Penicillium daleae]|uniref:Uncharacterized protein n=1 Tax=Penicillium daleae TaxID=63821 RepID=A0AAD6BYE3_9EURO|nr:uncharacterized protein N7458_009019 [Penicillium daleae]KAJ5438021.1 hypothetical protein N7458_009019 [Penicillium daleae]
MQFYAVLLEVATLLATTANAADCFSDSGSQICLNSTDLLKYREWLCTYKTWANNMPFDWLGANGHIATFTPSNVPNEQSCWDSTLDIIDQCLGYRNGGAYSLDGWSMTIDFCVDTSKWGH